MSNSGRKLTFPARDLQPQDSFHEKMSRCGAFASDTAVELTEEQLKAAEEEIRKAGEKEQGKAAECEGLRRLHLSVCRMMHASLQG